MSSAGVLSDIENALDEYNKFGHTFIDLMIYGRI